MAGRSARRANWAMGRPFSSSAPWPPARARRRGGTPFPFAQAGAPSGKTVLVIDDEQWILDLAGELLRTEGHAVEVASSGQQAIELVSRQKFAVVVSDW